MCTSRCAAVSFSMPVSRICSKYFAHFACSTVHKYVETCRTGKHKELWTHLQTFPPQLFAAFPLHKQLRRVYHRPNIKWLSVKVHHISFVLLVQNATVLFAFLASGLRCACFQVTRCCFFLQRPIVASVEHLGQNWHAETHPESNVEEGVKWDLCFCVVEGSIKRWLQFARVFPLVCWCWWRLLLVKTTLRKLKRGAAIFSVWLDKFISCDVAKPFPVQTCWIIAQVLCQRRDCWNTSTKKHTAGLTHLHSVPYTIQIIPARLRIWTF